MDTLEYIVKKSEFQAKGWKLLINNRSLLGDFKLESLQILFQQPYKKGFRVGETRERGTREEVTAVDQRQI